MGNPLEEGDWWQSQVRVMYSQTILERREMREQRTPTQRQGGDCQGVDDSQAGVPKLDTTAHINGEWRWCALRKQTESDV